MLSILEFLRINLQGYDYSNSKNIFHAVNNKSFLKGDYYLIHYQQDGNNSDFTIPLPAPGIILKDPC